MHFPVKFEKVGLLCAKGFADLGKVYISIMWGWGRSGNWRALNYLFFPLISETDEICMSCLSKISCLL